MGVETFAYGLRVKTQLTYEAALTAIRAALKEQGFGVLTEVDVRKTLREKLGADVGPYVILGACNPHLAYEGLQRERDLGLLLPCNVIVYEEQGAGVVAAIDPVKALSVVQNPALADLAPQVRAKLEAALKAVAEEGTG